MTGVQTCALPISRLSYQNHIRIEERNVRLSEDFSAYERNKIYYPQESPKDSSAAAQKGIAAGGISFTYVMEALKSAGTVPVLKVSTPHPFPERLALQFLDGLDEVLCLEELDPVIENELLRICGKFHLPVKIYGKLTHHVKNAGENSRDSVYQDIQNFLGLPAQDAGAPDAAAVQKTDSKTFTAKTADAPALPIRPPVLCAGCPHRASFYAVKTAMKGKKTIFCGDIGCYTLGNAMPLDMVDTCLCMGAGLGIAQGVSRIEPDTYCFAFVGDSTFFASAITGAVNAVYNQADMTLIILDNSTTAMTGHQPHPGTGRTMMGGVSSKVDIEAVLRGIGLAAVETVDPLDLEKAVTCVKRTAEEPGVKAVIFRSPCIAVTKPAGTVRILADKCISCKKCIRELGCPALTVTDGRICADPSLCTGCTLCSQLCPAGAMVMINGGDSNE